MAGLNELLSYIKDKATSMPEHHEEGQGPLFMLFEEAVQQTMREIKHGAPSDEFAELVVINFIISAASDGYPRDTIRSFMADVVRLEPRQADGDADLEDDSDDDVLDSLVASQSGIIL